MTELNHPNHLKLEAFYKAFSLKDAESMNQLYHEKATFSDPVFKNLPPGVVKKMWHMLCSRGKDLTIEFRVIEADDQKGKAEWTARYTFSGTGKKVINHIQSRFDFVDGKVIAQQDDFDFYTWARQAFGLKGLLFGWMPWFKQKVRKGAVTGLNRYP